MSIFRVALLDGDCHQKRWQINLVAGSQYQFPEKRALSGGCNLATDCRNIQSLCHRASLSQHIDSTRVSGQRFHLGAAVVFGRGTPRAVDGTSAFDPNGRLQADPLTRCLGVAAPTVISPKTTLLASHRVL